MFQSVWRKRLEEVVPLHATHRVVEGDRFSGRPPLAVATGTSGSPSIFAVTTGASESSATRSITLASSRMLPGHR